MNLANNCISIYRKADSSPGHATFLILHDNKQSSHIRGFIIEITKRVKMHKSLNIALVKTSTVSFN